MSKKIAYTILSIVLVIFMILLITFLTLSTKNVTDEIKQEMITINSVIKNNYSEGKDIKDILNTNNKNISIFITDKDGNALEIYGEDIKLDKSSTLISLDRNSEVISSNDGKNKFKLIKTDKLKNDLLVTTTYNKSIFNKLIKDNIEYIISYFLIVIISTLFIAMKIGSSIVEPIDHLTLATSKISKGELNSRIKLNRTKELEDLANNFNNIADRLESTVIESVERQNRLESILSCMNSGVIAIDKNNKIIIFNNSARALFNIYSDVIGKDITEVLKNTNTDELITIHQEPKEIEIENKDILTLRYKTTKLNGMDNKENGKVIVVQDISDLKRLEAMRSQFVANVSHELKTPLTSIRGYSETLHDVEDKAIREKFLNIIEVESDRLTRLIEDILSLSSIENSHVTLFEVVDVVPVLQEACSLLEKQAQKKGIELVLTTKGTPKFIGEDDKFKQMIINLVDNAIKYTENTGKVKVRLQVVNNNIEIAVQDNGVGIPQEHLPRLFERFYRVSKSRDRAKGGTGLGLAIVKHIVLLFNGNIDVTSELGKGTTFTVTIPQLLESTDKSVNDESNNSIKSFKFN